MSSSLTGKVALVTGASRGIGAAVSTQLAAAGATVYGTATSEAGAAAISERIAEAGHQGAGIVLNVNEPESIAAALKLINEQAGAAPTILVNNAGIARDQLLMRLSEDDWNAVIDTNLRSIYRLSKACMRGMMKARWGRIINISSVIGLMGNAGQSSYAAAKAGIMGFSKSLAREVGSRSITVNVVAPGFITTDMTDNLDDAQREAMLKDIPLARLGQVDDIAAAVGFLASDGAAYITGETLNVNGGMYMH
jgi:3-oxoacyl-[acyl-carrier protein] reductase